MKYFILIALACLTLLSVSGATSSAQAAKPQCMDRIDNDGDGKIDYPADPGCLSKNDNDETDVIQPPPPPPATPIVTSNIHDMDTVNNGTTWNVSYDQTVTSTEFWANGSNLSIDTSAPYSQTINLPIGANRLGLVVNVGGNRYIYGINGSCTNCGGTFANITIPDSTPPPSGFTTCGGNSSIPACSSGAFFVRTHENPEVLPPPYPYCCGIYFDTQTNDTYYDANSGSYGRLDPDPLNASNHVFHSHVANSTAYADFAQENMQSNWSKNVPGTETWQSFKVYFPSTFKPTGYSSGQQDSRFNWIHEAAHEDGNQPCQGSGYDSGNHAIGIWNVGPSNSHPGEHFLLEIFGGQQTSTNCGGSGVQLYYNDDPFLRNHVYTITEHIKWSADGIPGNSPGLTEVYFDGVKKISAVTPNLYRHPDGSVEVSYSFLGYYRWAGTTIPTTWSDDVYYDDWRNGPTAASIGFTP